MWLEIISSTAYVQSEYYNVQLLIIHEMVYYSDWLFDMKITERTHSWPWPFTFTNSIFKKILYTQGQSLITFSLNNNSMSYGDLDLWPRDTKFPQDNFGYIIYMFAMIEVNWKVFFLYWKLLDSDQRHDQLIFDSVNPNPLWTYIEHISIIYSNTKFDNTSIKNWPNGEPYNYIATKKENISITFSDLSEFWYTVIQRNIHLVCS